MNEIIILTGIPIPPSVNGQYATIVRRGRPIRIKSKEAVDYIKAFELWAIQNFRNLNEARNSIILWNSKFIEVAMYAGFKRERLICKDGSPKKMDISNRVKLIHDLLALKINVDDCCFVRTPAEKCYTEGAEGLTIIIRPRDLRKLEDLSISIFDESTGP